ncbi:mCG140107 [Mus musculus]|nr:mCG140107 [Mus musculus]
MAAVDGEFQHLKFSAGENSTSLDINQTGAAIKSLRSSFLRLPLRVKQKSSLILPKSPKKVLRPMISLTFRLFPS